LRLTNYTKARETFVHQLSIEPLRDPAGETRCFQATSLVLQMPGTSAPDAVASDFDRPPLMTDQPTVPPLWPLLGRAVRPDEPPPTATRQLPAPAPTLQDLQTSIAFDDDATGDMLLAADMMKADDLLSWLQEEEG